jgi:hypothetical protein
MDCGVQFCGALFPLARFRARDGVDLQMDALRGDYTCGKNLAVLVQCCKVLRHAVAVTVL